MIWERRPSLPEHSAKTQECLLPIAITPRRMDHGYGPSGRVDATPRPDCPTLRRLLGLAFFLALGYGLWLCRPPADPMAAETKFLTSTLPAVSLSDYEKVVLPDGQSVKVTYRGLVPTFAQLPKNPALGDQYHVTEGGAKEGITWIWYTPLGWDHPAWVDP
jgi:hypothetical protein